MTDFPRHEDSSGAEAPFIVAMRGKPVLPLGSFDLATIGYTANEFSIGGTATSYKLNAAAQSNGQWDVTRAETAAYVTRLRCASGALAALQLVTNRTSATASIRVATDCG